MHRTPPIRWARCVAAALAAGLLAAACEPPPPMAARPTGEAFSTAPLFHDGAAWTAPGVEGALVLSSSEPRFGGWSGLTIHGYTLTAVSDRGYWLRVTWEPGGPGGLTLSEPRFGTLTDTKGEPLRRGPLRDAEEIVALPDGSRIVAFERDHRLWLYPPADPPFSVPPRRLAGPEGLEDAPYNGGLEALARLPDGRLVALVEGDGGTPETSGWIGTPAPGPEVAFAWEPIRLALTGGFRPTGAAVAANGDLLVLERAFSIPAGFSSRIRRVPAATIGAGGVLDGPEVFSLARPPVNDNFEGMAALPLPDGRTRVLLLSDDNYSGLQRTLLVALSL